MDMTLEQYILNPMGKNNAVLNASTREIMRKDYMRRFDNLMLRENGKIEYYLYKDAKSNTYWAHIKVPSETVKEFYYDVVLKFYANQSTDAGGEDLFKYFVKFYSNDPAFVFTYAHTFLKNDLFIKELSSKMSRQALKKDAKEKNPGDNIGYVKTIYFAYLLLKNRNLNKKFKFEAESKSLDPKYLLVQIEDADTKIEKRQEEGSKVSKRKKVQVSNTSLKNMSRYFNSDTDASRIKVTTTRKVGTIQNKANSNIKSTKRTISTKRK